MVRCGCSAPLLLLLVTMVVVIAAGGLGHCQFQTSSQTDECKNVKKVGKNAVRNKHTRNKVAKTWIMRVSIACFFTKMRKDRAKVKTTPLTIAKRFPSLPRFPNQSHKIQAFWHTYSTHIMVDKADTHTRKMSVESKAHVHAVTYHYLFLGERGWASLWFSAAKKVEKCHHERFAKPIWGIIHIQWVVLIGSAFLAWQDSYNLHNCIFTACWRTRRLKTFLNTLIVSNTPTKRSRKIQFT